jgi:competence protein ComEC
MNPLVRRIAPFVLVTLWLTLTAVAQEPEIKFHFIDVGQADSTLIEAPCGAVLIDAGAQDRRYADRLIAYLDGFFARRTDLQNTLKLVGITHNHTDHTAVLRRIVQKYNVERYVDNGRFTVNRTNNPNWVRQEIAQRGRAITLGEMDNAVVARTRGGRGLTNGVIDPLKCRSCDPVIRVLSGGRRERGTWTSSDFRNENNHSVVWRIDFGQTSLLITGDLEQRGIEDIVQTYRTSNVLDTDIYHVGHHGAANATSSAFLAAMTPALAVISMGPWPVGADNRGERTAFSYGHPRLSVVQLLQTRVTKTRTPKVVKAATGVREAEDYQVQKAIYGTGWDGTVVMSGKLNGQIRTATGN